MVAGTGDCCFFSYKVCPGASGEGKGEVFSWSTKPHYCVPTFFFFIYLVREVGFLPFSK